MKNLKLLTVLFFITVSTCFVDQISARRTNESSWTTPSDFPQISYRIYQEEYVPGYLVEFRNNTDQKLQIDYIFIKYNNNGDLERPTNYVRVGAYGENHSQAAGDDGRIRIIDVHPPMF